MLPGEVVKKIRASNPSWFAEGDTIRKKDLTLSFAPYHLVEERRRMLRENQNANEAVFRPGRKSVGNSEVYTEKDNSVTAEEVSPADRFS
jgi:hypothetical protein